MLRLYKPNGERTDWGHVVRWFKLYMIWLIGVWAPIIAIFLFNAATKG